MIETSSPLRIHRVIATVALGLLVTSAAEASDRCITADAGGVAVFPPTASARGFESVPGTLLINGSGNNVVVGDQRLRNIVVTGITPVTGGLAYDFTATLDLVMRGNGTYLGFDRTLTFPVAGRLFAADQVPGQLMQDIDLQMLELTGSLPPGDPDFTLFSVSAGSNLGLPGPGHATMIRHTTMSTWMVEATFDFTYRVDHVGAPGSFFFAGLVGSTSSATRLRDGVSPRKGYGAPNAGGTAVFPPACDDPSGRHGHRSQWFVPVMTSGMPAGSPVFGDMVLRKYVVTSSTPGGSYGGAILQFTGECQIDLFGTGTFASYRRRVVIPVTGTMHSGPRTPGANVQGFPSEIMALSGALLGDSQFNRLEIVAGAGHALPSPGHTTLSALPGIPHGNSEGWNVDSFFDLHFRIDFEGQLGGPFAGRSGSTTSSMVMLLGASQFSYPVMPDMGGTARFPVDGGYAGPPSLRLAVDALPAGSPLLGSLTLTAVSVTQTSGGALNGNAQSFSGKIDVQLTGVGANAGYSRLLTIPISGQSASAPRGGAATPQSFESDIVSVFGQILNDSDFSLFRVTAGSSFGMPSPGHTVFIRHENGSSWYSDSYFDLTYQIEFNGAAGGPFAGVHSVTTSANRFQAGSSQQVGVEEPSSVDFRMGAPFPNPARGTSTLRFELPGPRRVQAMVIDVTGRRVRSLPSGTMSAGSQVVSWDGRDESGRPVAAGLYFYRLDIDGRQVGRRVAVTR